MLRIRNIFKNLGSRVILKDVNALVEQGAILGLAGSSGSGKSTLLRCIGGLEAIDSGLIESDGPSGFMFQDFQLFPHMNVIENLIYAPSLRDKKKDHRDRANNLLENLGIADKAKSFPRELSGGQKQRVALARSLMMQPKLLLCDEPTSGLDVATIEDVVLLLKSVKITMVIASHDLDFLTKIADRVVVLKNSEVALNISINDLNDPVHHLRGYY